MDVFIIAVKRYHKNSNRSINGKSKSKTQNFISDQLYGIIWLDYDDRINPLGRLNRNISKTVIVVLNGKSKSKTKNVISDQLHEIIWFDHDNKIYPLGRLYYSCLEISQKQ